MVLFGPFLEIDNMNQNPILLSYRPEQHEAWVNNDFESTNALSANDNIALTSVFFIANLQ